MPKKRSKRSPAKAKAPTSASRNGPPPREDKKCSKRSPVKGGIQTSTKRPKPARKVVSDDVQPPDLTPEQLQQCSELTRCPAGEVVAVPAIRGAFAQGDAPTPIDEGAAADDPAWVRVEFEMTVAGSGILCLLEHADSSQLSEAETAIAMPWIERLGWAIPNLDASPQQRLLAWIGENDAELALDWLLVGRAKSCCELLAHVRRLRESGLGQKPIIGSLWLVDTERPGSRASDTPDWYRAAFESICRDFQNLELLLDHAFRWLRIPPLPSENFRFEATVADIDKRGGAAAEMKRWTSAVCSESDAWRWIYDRVKSYFANQITRIEVALAWYIVRLQEVPHGWESARERHYPVFPIKNVDDLRTYAKSAHQQIAASRSSNQVRPLVILPDAQMVLRNVRRSLREWAIPEPEGFTDNPTDIHEAERQLELVVDSRLNPSSKSGYLGIVLNKDKMTIGRESLTAHPISLSPLLWSICKLLVDAAADGVPTERLKKLEGEASARKTAVNQLRQAIMHSLNLTVADARATRRYKIVEVGGSQKQFAKN